VLIRYQVQYIYRPKSPREYQATLLHVDLWWNMYSSVNNVRTLPEVFRMDLCDYFRILAWSFLQRGAALHFALWN
jgi:hypothetical protein